MVGMIHINCNKLLKTDIIRRNKIRYKEIPVNEDYMFMVDGKYAELNRKSISLLPNIQNWNSQESLRTNLPCSVTPLE